MGGAVLIWWLGPPSNARDRVPDAAALVVVQAGAERVVQVTDAEVADAMRALWTDTHNLAEDAGAAAALVQERERMQGKRVAVVLCRGNVDLEVALRVLGGC